MSHWDGHTIISFPPRLVQGHPEWLMLDCGCCNGLKWGGDEPIECRDCAGTGVQYLHLRSGVIAVYPGGPLLGRIDKQTLTRYREGINTYDIYGS